MVKKYGRVLFWMVCVLLAVLRFAWLGFAPLRYDESHQLIRAAAGVDALRLGLGGWLGVVSDPSKIFHVLSVDFFGTTEFATRLPVVIQSLVITAFIFLIGRRFFGEKIARIALLVSLILPFNFAYGRYAQYDIGQVFYFIIGVYFLFLWIYERRALGRWLSPLFFALAFLSKYNALILQGIILFSYVLCDVRGKRRYLLSAENLILTGLFTVVLSIHQMPAFLANMAGWLATIAGFGGGTASESGGGLVRAVFTSVRFHFDAFTFLWFPMIGYGIVCFKKMNERERLLFLATGFYFCAVTVQGRLQVRYLNLESFLVALLMAIIFVRWTGNRRKIWLGGAAICAGLIQCGYQYYNYYCYETHTVPCRQIHKELETLDDTVPAIYLPKNFPRNYAGIYQLDMMIARDGVEDLGKAQVYHFSHMPFPYEKMNQEDPSSRMEMERAIVKSVRFLSTLDIAGVKNVWVSFIQSEKKKTTPGTILLDQFFKDPSIPSGSVYVQEVQGAGMYPVLGRRDVFRSDVDIPYQKDVQKIFYISRTKSPCLVFYTKP